VLGIDTSHTAWWTRPPSPFSSSCLLLLGVAMLLACLPVRRRWATGAATAALGITLSAGIGHLYGVSRFYGMTHWGGMAITTALGLGAVALGLLVRDPHRGMAALFVSRRGSGRMLRRLAPIIVVGPILLGWLVRALVDGRVIDSPFGTALLVVVLIFVLAAVMLRTAKVLDGLDQALADALDHEQRSRLAAEQRKAELERINESRAKLIRGFSHDVRTPLGTARNFAWLLQRQLAGADVPSQANESARGVQRAVEGAVQLIDDLLEVAMAEAGEIPVHAVPVHLDALVTETAIAFQAEAERRGLELVLRAKGDVRVLTDPARVRQIVGNLVSNALKYTPRGRVVVDVDTSEDGPREGRWARVCVIDTGPGIADEKKPLVFLEYTRLDPSQAPGMGIGLAISRQVARRLQGDITVHDAEGGGASFTLWLPLAAGDARATDGDGPA
ncbi:MAG TPA: HAMP domain-containing sensor histidine kinase, partial [Lysobacter sp.]